MTNPHVNGKLRIQLQDLEAAHLPTLQPTVHFQIHPVPAQTKQIVKQVDHQHPHRRGEVLISAKIVTWLIQSIQGLHLPLVQLNLLQ